MNYFEAVQDLKRGFPVQSVASGRVLTPSEMGQIWVGKHWASHNTIHLTREELGGLWKLSEASVESLYHTSVSWKEIRKESC